MRAEAAYAELLDRAREKALLAGCAELLAWDEATYLPAAGAEHRAAQLALLAGMLHERATDPRIGDLLAAVEGSDLVTDPESVPAVNVRDFRRLYDWETCLPRSLVEETARVTSLAEQEWAAARQAADFARFRPWLERVIVLCRQSAEAVDSESDPYDVLLRHYEPDLTAAGLAALFADLRCELLPLANEFAYARRQPDRTFLGDSFPPERQRQFGERAAAALGFDFSAGRLDTTTHPFYSTIGPGDCRITTRFRPNSFREGFFAILHEAGHGLYEQNLPPEHFGTPVGEAPSQALHESQARLWENAVGHSRGFWAHFLPAARDAFSALDGVGLDEFHFAVNTVEPTLIRAAADEVTYDLHVLIRFDLERALIAGELAVADLPAAWADAYRHALGITPPNDTEGCLQDGHWAAGMFGYFPVYTVGNLLAAQLFAAARADLGDLETAFARSEFRGLLDWLREKIYRHGGRYSVEQLMTRATGAPLHTRPFLDGLRRKFGELYGS